MSNKAKHTPGPWKFCPVTQKIWTVDTDLDVGTFCGGPEMDQWEPNARLMAAAPELADALRTMLAVYCGEHGTTRDVCQAAEQAARAALEKTEEITQCKPDSIRTIGL